MPPKSFKISEIGQVVGGGTPPTSITEYYGGNIPWLSPKDLSTHKGRYIKHGERNLSELGLSNSGAKLMPAGTVLLSSRAPIGYLAIAANDICTNQGFKSIIPDKKLVNSEFLYYYLKCHIEEIKDLGSGTTFAEISGKVLENYEVFLPELDVQRQIAHILSQLDDKIELNQIINDNLARILDVEYSKIKGKYESECFLSDICEIVKIRCNLDGLTIYNYYSTENMLENKGGVTCATSLPSDGKVTKCFAGDTLISNIRPYFKKIHYCTEDSGCSADVVCFRAKKNLNSPYLYSILRSDEFFDYVVAGSKGTKMPRGDKIQMMKYAISLPPEEELCNFNNCGRTLLSLISQNSNTIKKLIDLRDFLLPKLMSGEIDVSSLADSQLNNHLLAGFLLVKNIIILLKSKLLGKLNEESISIVVSELTQILNDCIVETKKKEPEHQNADILNSFLSAKRLEGCSEKTISYYQSTLSMFLETSQCSITSINTDHIRNYLSEYQSKRKSSKVTIDNIRRIFSSFFSWLEDEEYILKSPVRRIHKVKFGRTVKETFTDEELERMRDSCDSIRNLSILDTFISTGMRVGELVRLNISDIDFNGRECIVFGKGDCERRVYFDARTKLHLQNYLEQRSDSNPALFVTQHKPIRRITINGIESMLKTLGKGIGIEDIHPHKFRRTMATRAIDKGMPIEQVQKLLGHVRIDTTLHYAMVNQENVKNAHKKYIA